MSEEASSTVFEQPSESTNAPSSVPVVPAPQPTEESSPVFDASVYKSQAVPVTSPSPATTFLGGILNRPTAKSGQAEEGILDGIFKSVSETIDSVTKPDRAADAPPEDGFFSSVIKSVSETIDGVTKDEPAKEGGVQEGFLDGFRKAVSDKIDAVKEELQKEGEAPQEGLFDGIIKSVSETIDSVTKDEPPNPDQPLQPGFFDGIIKSVSETIDSVTKDELPNPDQPPKPGFFDGIVKSVSETIDSVTKDESQIAPQGTGFGITSRFSSMFGRSQPTVQIKPVNLALLGSSAVGKTALVSLFASGHVVTEYDATVEDCYRKVIGPYHYIILDTGGDPNYQGSLDSWLVGRQGFMLVYSITSADSFEYLKGFADKIDRAKTPVLFVGCKADKEKERVVSKEQVDALSKEWNCAWIEVSALDQQQVNSAFQKLVTLCK